MIQLRLGRPTDQKESTDEGLSKPPNPTILDLSRRPLHRRSTGIANISCVTMKISEADFRRNFAATPDSATLYPKTGYSFTTPTRRTSLTSCGT
jgi:hypothetical protein